MDIKNNFKQILIHLGEDPEREGLKETPKRYIKFLEEFLSPPEYTFTTFDSEGYDEMIIESEIPFQSLCEHHCAPFWGTGAIAYVPNKKIVGLSKLARCLESFSRRLQNQERITMQVANFINEHLEPKGVAVLLKARHTCMEMRGVRKSGVWTTTSCLKGCFKEDLNCRNEFLQLVK
jgi:GTP cyclohydrolase I